MKTTISVLFSILMFTVPGMTQNRVAGAATQPARRDNDKPPQAAAVLQDPGEVYIIGPEDVLSIVVWDEPEFTTKATVRPDGKIGLPLLNDVPAAGLTPEQLRENLTLSLKALITGPRVSVVVEQIKSQVIYITGAVGKSGVYTLGGPMTIMELLVRAGGLSEFAKGEDIQILRKAGDKQNRLRFNYKTFVEGKDYQQNIRLRNGDMVIVP